MRLRGGSGHIEMILSESNESIRLETFGQISAGLQRTRRARPAAVPQRVFQHGSGEFFCIYSKTTLEEYVSSYQELVVMFGGA